MFFPVSDLDWFALLTLFLFAHAPPLTTADIKPPRHQPTDADTPFDLAPSAAARSDVRSRSHGAPPVPGPSRSRARLPRFSASTPDAWRVQLSTAGALPWRSARGLPVDANVNANTNANVNAATQTRVSPSLPPQLSQRDRLALERRSAAQWHAFQRHISALVRQLGALPSSGSGSGSGLGPGLGSGSGSGSGVTARAAADYRPFSPWTPHAVSALDPAGTRLFFF